MSSAYANMLTCWSASVAIKEFTKMLNSNGEEIAPYRTPLVKNNFYSPSCICISLYILSNVLTVSIVLSSSALTLLNKSCLSTPSYADLKSMK